jgi:uncharacterized phage-associated protein
MNQYIASIHPLFLEPMKWQSFTYIVQQLIAWSDSEGGTGQRSSFTKLKLLKLLFFVSAADSSEGEYSLLRVFENFYAMPYGHVESDIYNLMREYNVFDYKPLMSEDVRLNDAQKKVIDSAIANLKDINRKIVLYTANQLVDLSHEWYSWKSMYNMARSSDKYSVAIPADLIKHEHKFYSL